MAIEPTAKQTQYSEELRQQWPDLDESIREACELQKKACKLLIEGADKHNLSANSVVEILYVLHCWAWTQFLGLLPVESRIGVLEDLVKMSLDYSQDQYGSLGVIMQESLKDHPEKLVPDS